MREETEVVVVGSRCAGSATAIALARRGRSVIALDGASFPSDTLSTHLLFPPAWAELERLGARERVLALGAPLHARGSLATPGVELADAYSPYEGFAHGACVRRPGFDLALVGSAREAGAEVRERTRVTGLLRDADGRVGGVRWTGRDGSEGEIGARLVVGADGRRSTVARLVGARAHHERANRRMLAFAYYRDGRPGLRDTAMQMRDGDDLALVFPCDGEQALVATMPPVTRGDEFREDAESAFDAALARVPAVVARLRGCSRVSKIRVSTSHPAYFRHSHGPGWALTGDAGHFKDPVIAQGIRDALRFGRLLGEATAPALDDDEALDAVLAAWEADRDAQCLPAYQWGNALGADDTISPIEAAAYAWLADETGRTRQILDVFCRLREPEEVFTPARAARWAAAAARDPATDRGELRATAVRDVWRELRRIGERRAFARRRSRSAGAPADPAR